MKCYIINSKINYDVIIGRKFMSEAQFKLDFSTNTVSWYDEEMSFHARSYFNDMCLIEKCTSNKPIAVAEMYTAQAKRVAYVDSSTKYEETDLIQLAQNQKHLDDDTRGELQSMLLENAKLFESLEGRTLGIFPDREFNIELIPGAVPFHIKQPYSIPLHQRAAVKRELLRQLSLGILERCYATAWGMPMFCVYKTDNTARVIADVRELNKVSVPKQYPLPKIQDIFHRRKGYVYVTLFDISMQFHTFKLNERSSWLCVIVTPFGKFRYLRLPMGYLSSPAWAQGEMTRLFEEMTCVEIYIDDIAVFNDDLNSHLIAIESQSTR